MPTVRTLIERQAAERPDAVFALDAEGDAVLRFGDLARALPMLHAWLEQAGAAPGRTVAVVMPNGLGTLRLLLGVMATGRTVVPVNLLSQPEVLHHVLEHSDCTLVVCTPDWQGRVAAALAGVGRTVAVRLAEPAALALPGEVNLADAGAAHVPLPADLALLMYTSGTTGKPKGVMLSHAHLVANAHAITAEHALSAADRVLGVLPLYHINGFVVTMLTPLASGGSVAMAPRFSATRFWAQAAEHRCTWLNGVPTIVSALLQVAAPERAALARLRFFRSASAALPVEHLHAFEQRFGLPIIEAMGLTETAAPAFSNPLDAAVRKPGSVGRASGCECRVIDAATLGPVAEGATGELAIRGPQVMRGYYKDEAATAAAFTPEGWLRTGDLGHRDADGFFFVTGRIKELIIKGGENIAPREIDEVLLRHPAVLDAAAVGIADAHYGQEIMACIVLREGAAATAEDLRAHCEAQLGRYKTPKVLRFVNDLPRGPSGKVQRLKLRDLAP